MSSDEIKLRKRIWFLFIIAGCVKAEVQAILGLSKGQLAHRIRKYDLGWLVSPAYWAGESLRPQAALELEIINEEQSRWLDARSISNRIGEWLEGRLSINDLDWSQIDNLSVSPPPPRWE